MMQHTKQQNPLRLASPAGQTGTEVVVGKSRDVSDASSRQPPPSPLTPRRRGAGALRLLLVAGLGALLLIGNIERTPLRAQDDEATAASREYRIKAAYLYQFGRYIEWPAKTFPDAKSPFLIGVLDGNVLVEHLEQIAESKKIQDRAIKVLRFTAPDDVRPCHILFLSSTVASESQSEIIRRMAGRGVLPVGESEGFLDWGGVVRFVVEDNKVRIYIARKAAEREGLTISAKLLQVAHVVD